MSSAHRSATGQAALHGGRELRHLLRRGSLELLRLLADGGDGGGGVDARDAADSRGRAEPERRGEAVAKGVLRALGQLVVAQQAGRENAVGGRDRHERTHVLHLVPSRNLE